MPEQPTNVRPKLRPLEVQRVEQDGQRYYMLRDSLGLGDGTALVPETLGPLLALCDGTRDLDELADGFFQRTGVKLPRERVGHIVGSLSEAVLLYDNRFELVYERAVKTFRDLPYRPPTHAGAVYPSDPIELERTFTRYLEDSGTEIGTHGFEDSARIGIISPHIDYDRGWKTYAHVWSHGATAIKEAELVVVFGTDHSGGPGRITLTRQNYATPYGTLPTETSTVNQLADALGEDLAFAEEYHHRSEHSIELALVWLHHFLHPRKIPLVPVLCGSFYPFVLGQEPISSHPPVEKTINALRQIDVGRNTLYVAAGDFAHVGPSFGDELPWSQLDREKLRGTDQSLLASISCGDSIGFFDQIRSVGDRNRVCGTSPIYMMLRMLEGEDGFTTSYDQCPADPDNSSLVSIAGAVIGLPNPHAQA